MTTFYPTKFFILYAYYEKFKSVSDIRYFDNLNDCINYGVRSWTDMNENERKRCIEASINKCFLDSSELDSYKNDEYNFLLGESISMYYFKRES